MYNPYNINPYPCYVNPSFYNSDYSQTPSGYMSLPVDTAAANPVVLKDYGPDPFTVNIEEATLHNRNFRTALWTGDHLQLTLMSINVGEDIGVEMHPDLDQFIRIEEGRGIVQMGDSRNNFEYQREVDDDYIIIIPAGKWHNLINTGNRPIKLYSIYAPPQHPHGTVHQTRSDAMAAERNHEY
ncbi:MAG: cupin domain-containing protein [Clostridiaceae bacterium]|nr:cupin domain-containing protein [Clostridiaceae bacterium]